MPLDPVLVDAVKTGECLLFIGAGVHYPPSDPQSPFLVGYPDAVRPPLGSELARRLAARGGQPSYIQQMFPNEAGYEGNLARTSALYEIARGRNDLVAAIIQEVDVGKKPSAAVKALAALPFRLIATTNYDKLFEKALGVQMKAPVRDIYNPSRNHTTTIVKTPKDPSAPAFWKMHGCVDHPASLIVTDEDYITFMTRMRDLERYNPVPRPFQNALVELPALFIGYSLADFNFRLLLRNLRYGFDIGEMVRNYAVNPRPDPVVQHALNDQVHFIVEDLWAFIPSLYQAVIGQPMPL